MSERKEITPDEALKAMLQMEEAIFMSPSDKPMRFNKVNGRFVPVAWCQPGYEEAEFEVKWIMP